MFTHFKLKIKTLLSKILNKLYAPIFKELQKPLGGGGIEMLLRKEFLRENHIAPFHQSIEEITQKGKIFIRLGDGELPILHGQNGGFHRYSKDLREKLLEAYYFALSHQDFLIGVNGDLIYPYTNLNDQALISSCMNYKIMDFLRYFPLQTYANALLLRIPPITLYHEKYHLNNYQILLHQSFTPDFYQKDKLGIEIFEYYQKTLIEPFKRLWDNKNVIICEGKFSSFGLYNDLFEYAKSTHRIQANNQNAFDDYTKILQSALSYATQYDNDEVFFVCALGHTSKILLVDLYKNGFKNGIDAGNFSIAYDSFLHNFPFAWVDDGVQTIAYPPIYYGKNLKQWERNNA